MKPESRWGELISNQIGNMILFRCVLLHYHTHHHFHGFVLEGEAREHCLRALM